MNICVARYAATLASAVLLTTAADAAIDISSRPTQNMSCSGGVCTATAKKAVLNVNDLAAMLAAGDATVKSGSSAQDIDIKAAISWTSASRLTLDSYHSIAFEKPLTVAGSGGGLTITTNDGGFAGDFTFSGQGHVEFWDVNVDRLMINGNQYQLAKSSHAITGKYKKHGGYAHYVALAKSYNAIKEGVHSSFIIGEVRGIFEGLGNTISNLSIQDSLDRDVGFVGDTWVYGGIVRDLNLRNATVSVENPRWDQESVGLLIGDAEGTGLNGPAFFRCSATGQVTVGENASGTTFAGGLAGRLWAVGSQSFADVQVSAGDNSMVGGLVGNNYAGAIEQSYATGPITAGKSSSAGGLAGSNGWNHGTQIIDSYSTGSVVGDANSSLGGLVGENQNAVSSSYSTGVVSGGSGTIIGGLIGSDTSPSGNLSADYWDLDTSGISDPSQGAGNVPNDPGISGLTDSQLKSGLPAGFDSNVWAQNPSISNGYPYLRANPPPK